MFPNEIMELILLTIDNKDMLAAASVSKLWRECAKRVCERRNRIFFRFINEKVLDDFKSSHWILAGSASLWMRRYVSGRFLWWIPNDIDVWYIGALDEDIDDTVRLSEYPVLEAQPLNTPCLFSMNNPHLGMYSRSIRIPFDLTSVQIIFAPDVVRRQTNDKSKIIIAFDLPFLQIGVQKNDSDKITFILHPFRTMRKLTTAMMRKYALKLGDQFPNALNTQYCEFSEDVVIPT